MIIEAFKPAVPREIIMDEKNHRIVLKVATDDLAIAIGRKGQNARLTSRLVGWRLDIEEFKAAGDDPRGNAIALLVKTFELNAAIAGRLVDMGINSPAAFEGVTAEDLVGGGFTPEEAKDIIARITPA
jgi:N utilization substance protein A